MQAFYTQAATHKSSEDLSERNPDRAGRSELHYAAVEGRLADAQRLIQSGEDVSLPDKMKMTPLHMTCQQGNADVAKALLQAGAQVDPKDAYGNTPLWRAVFAYRGDGELVRMLLRYGADPDGRNAAGKSPRDMALTLDRPGARELFAE